MILKRFYDDKLAQASYLLGCPGVGEAIVIDPHRDVDVYIQAAAAEGLRITAVTETHIHADFVSGTRELAARTGATMYLSDEGDVDWKYGFTHDPNVTLVKDGDTFGVGSIRLTVLHTPGHTPEHISFLLTDLSVGDYPQAVFSGDFVFVGDVGRPDLLERAANFQGTMEKGARVLYGSLQKFLREQPDSLMIWPAHGAGSACGKSLGGVPVSSLGYERVQNWGLRANDEDAFVSEVLAGQPEPPLYFKEMKRINKVGAPILGGMPHPGHLPADGLASALASDAVVLDVRPRDAQRRGFLPGSLTLAYGPAFTTWAGWLVPYDRPVYLVAPDAETARLAARDMAMIGLDHVRGWFGPEAIAAHAVTPFRQVSGAEARAMLDRGEARLLDVRGQSEWDAGHHPDAVHIPLGHLRRRRDEIPADRPLIVHCAAGTRSAMAVSVLRQLGIEAVLEIPGGYTELAAATATPALA